MLFELLVPLDVTSEVAPKMYTCDCKQHMSYWLCLTVLYTEVFLRKVIKFYLNFK